MAVILNISIFYNEEINQCEVTWSADRTEDLAPVEQNTLEALKKTLMSQLQSGIPYGQAH
ncbi:hypothetical protein [Xenorhabdus szentirmaii]|uniref:hypothetical protein n=1 Tax=Xenorhabdus szentirmaii TaxID=290112 RepID=UPI00198FF39D|nr:hypothetical protein [Xenorhabdus sp. 38]MBD2782423.1 hypothetical protein [Xenorhabdus sp. 38]